MVPLYAARIEDLGPGDFVKVIARRAARRLLRSSAELRCSHAALLAPAFLDGLGLSPRHKMLDSQGWRARRGLPDQLLPFLGSISSKCVNRQGPPSDWICYPHNRNVRDKCVSEHHSIEAAQTPAGAVQGYIGTLAGAVILVSVELVAHDEFGAGIAGIIGSALLAVLAYKWPTLHARFLGFTLSPNKLFVLWAATVVTLILGLAYSPYSERANGPLSASPQIAKPQNETTHNTAKVDPALEATERLSSVDRERLADALYDLSTFFDDKIPIKENQVIAQIFGKIDDYKSISEGGLCLCFR
jgi:hypothetical protein